MVQVHPLIDPASQPWCARSAQRATERQLCSWHWSVKQPHAQISANRCLSSNPALSINSFLSIAAKCTYWTSSKGLWVQLASSCPGPEKVRALHISVAYGTELPWLLNLEARSRDPTWNRQHFLCPSKVVEKMAIVYCHLLLKDQIFKHSFFVCVFLKSILKWGNAFTRFRINRSDEEGCAVGWPLPTPFNLPPGSFSLRLVSVASVVYILPEIFHAHVSKLPRHNLSPLFFKNTNGKVLYCSAPCFFLQQNFLKIISSRCLGIVLFCFALLFAVLWCHTLWIDRDEFGWPPLDVC